MAPVPQPRVQATTTRPWRRVEPSTTCDFGEGEAPPPNDRRRVLQDGGHRRSAESDDEVQVSELVPEIALADRFLVRRVDRLGGDEGGEQVEVAGLGLVQAREEAVHGL